MTQTSQAQKQELDDTNDLKPAELLRRIIRIEHKFSTYKNVVIDGKKMSNHYLRKFVKNMENQNLKPEGIIKALLVFDELIEKKQITKEMLKTLE